MLQPSYSTLLSPELYFIVEYSKLSILPVGDVD